MEPFNTLATFAANAVKFLIDIPFYIYLLVCSFKDSLVSCFRWRRKSLNGEIVLVTGAASGMGQNVVVKLAANFPSAVFVLWDINEKGLTETKDKCGELGAHKVYNFVVDLSNRLDVVQNANLVRQQIGQVTVLFNNAGLSPYETFLETTPESEERVIRVNLFSYMWTIREFLPGMISSGKGHLVSTCSIIGFYRFSHLGSYATSKYGLRGFLETLKLEMNQHPDIKFSTIYPGFVKTPMIEGLTYEPRYKIKTLQQTDVDQAADDIVEGILKEKEEIFVPGSLRGLKWFQGLIPPKFMNAFEKHLMRNLKYNGELLLTKDNKLEKAPCTGPLEITPVSHSSKHFENELSRSIISSK